MGKKAIIIGAGVGGLGTAVRLLGRGYEVKIYEKEGSVGGKVNIKVAEGFRFDLTASILMMPEIYQEIFSWVGKDYRDYLEFIRVDPIYRAFYPEGSSIDFSSDSVELTKTLEDISKEDAKGYYKFLSEAYEKYLIANAHFLQKKYRKPGDFFNFSTLYNATRLKTLSTTYDFVSKYIRNEKLRRFLCYQALYVGISSFHGPNIYTLIPATTMHYGLWHLKGGMYSYITALQKIILELGGAIVTGTEVEEILISEGRATGVKTSIGTDFSEVVICNADFPYAAKNLIVDSKYKGKYTEKKLINMKYSCSNFIIYLGLKKKYEALLVHNHYLGDDFKENIDAAFVGKLPEKPSFYIYCPSRIDDTMANSGMECLSIVVRVPNLMFNQIKWNKETISALRERVFHALGNMEGFEDIEENILYEDYLTPEDLETRFNSYGGTAYGLSPTLLQTNYFRPPIKSREAENLYFVGSSVHPGAGVSIVLLSSKLAAEEIVRDEQVKI